MARGKNRDTRWKEAEIEVATFLGGKLRPRSGGLAGHKGDVYTQTHLIEIKSTAKTTYRLKKDELTKCKAEAYMACLIPMFAIKSEATGVIMQLLPTHYIEETLRTAISWQDNLGYWTKFKSIDLPLLGDKMKDIWVPLIFGCDSPVEHWGLSYLTTGRSYG